MNILILTGKFGMGHFSAAATIASQIKEKFPDSDIIIEDIFHAANPKYADTIYRLYGAMINKASGFYNLVYQTSEHQPQNVRPPFMTFFFKVLHKLLNQIKPNVIISTLPFCSQLVSQYKKYYEIQIPLITCVTDISTHNEWINDGSDYYLVGSPSLKYELIAKGVAENKVFATGIPVKSQFENHREFILRSKKRLLIMGGGLGLLPKEDSFYQRLNAVSYLETTIITGKNQVLYEKLYQKYENIQVIGYTTEVYQYMKQADLILSKPGGITLFETIASELPILVLCPFLEQEIKNANFIQKNGIGKIIWDKHQDIIEEIQNVIFDEELLDTIRQNMCAMKQTLEPNRLSDILGQLSEKTVWDNKPKRILVSSKSVLA